MRIISVSVVKVPLSRAHPRTVNVSPVSSRIIKLYYIRFNPSIKTNRLPYLPEILMQAVAGKRPSLPFRPPMQGDSNISAEKLL